MTERCTSCGAERVGTFAFCPACGQPFRPATVGQSPAREEYAASYWFQQAAAKQVSRTKAGLIIVMVGLLLGFLPYISFVGGILTLIGIVIVVMGRGVFGLRHAYSAGAALAVFVGSFIAGILATLLLSFAMVDFDSYPVRIALQRDALVGFLWSFLPIQAAVWASVVLLTHALQSREGRFILLAVFTMSVLLTFAGTAYTVERVENDFPTTLGEAELEDFEIASNLWWMAATAPSSILLAVACYLPFKRIADGEIPEGASSSQDGPGVRATREG